ncbi:Hypothetical predicted protein [Mytilus galloprovincialis]|uniref:Attacin C-terminal domain-containing protein n=1 Tax=Mytilus galloprovincialis TaxID=29158 RepID=A0A8B6CIN9_MYTGA|nr:Hypothetical predicted protein [Mytilus galloprovincialis]
MNIKSCYFLVVIALYINDLVAQKQGPMALPLYQGGFGTLKGHHRDSLVAQKHKSIFKGELSRTENSGTPADLGLSHRIKNWELNAGGFASSNGHRGANLGVSHNRKNLKLGLSVFGDNQGERGVLAGFKWIFGRKKTHTAPLF